MPREAEQDRSLSGYSGGNSRGSLSGDGGSRSTAGSGSSRSSGGLGGASRSSPAGANGKEGDRSLSGRNNSGTNSDKEGDRSLSGRSSDKGDRVGSGSYSGGRTAGADSKEGDRSLSSDRGDRVGSGGFSGGSYAGLSSPDPSRFGGLATPTGFDSATSMTRSPSFRESEIGSMRDLSQMRSAQARESENKSMGLYDAAAQRTAAFNAHGKGPATSFRGSEMETAALAAYDKAVDLAVAFDAGTTNPYNVMNGGKHMDLEGMTIGEVLGMQKEMIAAGLPRGRSTAAGGIQAVNKTLAGIVAEMGMPMDTKFDRVAQRAIGRALVDRRVSQSLNPDGTVNPNKLANGLASEWAAFKSSTGKGVHDNVPGNKASVAHGDVLSVAQEIAAAANNRRPSFNAKYLGDVQIANARTRGTETTATASTESPEAAYFGEEPSTDFTSPDDAIGGAPKRGQFDRPFTQEEAAAPNPNDPTVPTGPYGVGVPGNRPKTNPNYQRGPAGDLVAGGLDVIAGGLPGVGQAATIANLGLSLFGLPTIGESIVDYVGKNPNQYEPGQTASRKEGDYTHSVKYVKKPGAKVATPAFGDKYLDSPFSDPTLRPTPREKWDTTPGSYAETEYS